MSDYSKNLAEHVTARVFAQRGAQGDVHLTRVELSALLEAVANHVIAGVAQIEDSRLAHARKLKGDLS